jgi:hypothetical protein
VTLLSSVEVDLAQWLPALEPLLMGSDLELRFRTETLLKSIQPRGSV